MTEADLADLVYIRLGGTRHPYDPAIDQTGDGPLNLGRAHDAGLIGRGDLVVLATSGLGFSGAATALQY